MYDWEYKAVIYENRVYCINCLPKNINTSSSEVQPIFASEEWDVYPVCEECQTEHTYMNLTPYGHTHRLEEIYHGFEESYKTRLRVLIPVFKIEKEKFYIRLDFNPVELKKGKDEWNMYHNEPFKINEWMMIRNDQELNTWFGDRYNETNIDNMLIENKLHTIKLEISDKQINGCLSKMKLPITDENKAHVLKLLEGTAYMMIEGDFEEITSLKKRLIDEIKYEHTVKESKRLSKSLSKKK